MNKVVYWSIFVKDKKHYVILEIADDYNGLIKIFDEFNITYSLNANSHVPIDPHFEDGNQVHLYARDLNSEDDLMIIDQAGLIYLFKETCLSAPLDNDSYSKLYNTPKKTLCTQILHSLTVKDRRNKIDRLKNKMETKKHK